MNHEYFKERISAWLDHGLPADEQRMIEEHLQSCRECRELLENLKRLNMLVEKHSGLGEGAYWEEMASRIDRRLQVGAAEKVVAVKAGPSGFKWRLIATAASIVLVAIIGWRWEQIFGPEQVIETVPADTTTKQTEQFRREETTAQRKTIEEHFETTTEASKENAAAKKRPTQKSLDRKITVTSKEATDTLKKSYRTAPSMAPSVVTNLQSDKYRPTADESKASMEGFAASPADTTADLTYWRQVRDQLMPMLAEPSVGRAKRIVATAATDQDSVRELTDTSLLKLDRQSKEKLLLESWYHIAALSHDTAEVNTALARLKKTAANDQLPEHKEAQALLKKLGTPVGD